MALNVSDIMELPSISRMQLIAGHKGLDRPITTVEIADYEFDPDLIPSSTPNLHPNSFIITSLLFAKNRPEQILPAVKQLRDIGVSALACKTVLFPELPDEVIRYAEEYDFPLFTFDRDLWFENIIFDIMYAVHFDDRAYLSEENLDRMMSSEMERNEMDMIAKGISLRLSSYISAAYISADQLPGDLDAGRLLRSFYACKNYRSKALMCRYRGDLLLLITSPRDSIKTHRQILREGCELLRIPGGSVLGMSRVHPHSDGLGEVFRESFYCAVASRIEGKLLPDYGVIGPLQFLIPCAGRPEAADFAHRLLDQVMKKDELRETILAYVTCTGEIATAAARMHLHQNTIRYRLGKIRQMIGLTDVSDAELYSQIKLALFILRLEGDSLDLPSPAPSL